MANSAQSFWITAFLDYDAADFDSGVAFWRAATGYQVLAQQSGAREFVSLEPGRGDPYLAAQRLGSGPTKLHLDVHVPDPWASAEIAERFGAEIVSESRHSHVVVRSPAGFDFCLIGTPASVVPGSARWPSGHRSRVSRFCIDVPRNAYAAEVTFARGLLGGAWRELEQPETALRPAGQWPIDLRLQPADFASEVTSHLHLVTDDLAAEVDRLVELGARQRALRTGKAILEAPGGAVLCVVALEAAALA